MSGGGSVHGGVIALWSNGRWRGVLIEGPSGSGKSDLALRALAQGFRLVSDDRTLLWVSQGKLFARAPDTLAGLIEARGFGILPMGFRSLARIDLVAECTPDREAIERVPEPRSVVRGGVELPLLSLWPFEPAAVTKLHHAVSHLGGGH
jgi:serine kinase of HPr protein (carbohydrate metabolism regulator)